jgi:hypoxanthine phosphoribosyltransferase
MAYLAKYQKDDFKQISWQEYGKTLESLFDKVSKYLRENDIKIDAVVPILREGAFAGTYLAFRLGIVRVLPIQYKYFYRGSLIELHRISTLPKVELPEKPTFLLVENNHCFGVTASTAAKDLKKKFPQCRIIYAADHVDYSYPKVEHAQVVIYGKLTNETRALSEKECKEKGLFPYSYIFPWEGIEEEWTTVKGEQFEYGDLKATMKNSRVEKVIKKD